MAELLHWLFKVQPPKKYDWLKLKAYDNPSVPQEVIHEVHSGYSISTN